MAKKFSPAPGVEILFDRSVTVEVKAPKSGRLIKIEDDAPEILVVALGSATMYYERQGDVWRDLSNEAAQVVGEIIDELEAAEPAKRAPKF